MSKISIFSKNDNFPPAVKLAAIFQWHHSEIIPSIHVYEEAIMTWKCEKSIDFSLAIPPYLHRGVSYASLFHIGRELTFLELKNGDILHLSNLWPYCLWCYWENSLCDYKVITTCKWAKLIDFSLDIPQYLHRQVSKESLYQIWMETNFSRATKGKFSTPVKLVAILSMTSLRTPQIVTSTHWYWLCNIDFPVISTQNGHVKIIVIAGPKCIYFI